MYISKLLRHCPTCHPHTNHICLYSRAAKRHRPLAGTHCAYPGRDGLAELCYLTAVMFMHLASKLKLASLQHSWSPCLVLQQPTVRDLTFTSRHHPSLNSSYAHTTVCIRCMSLFAVRSWPVWQRVQVCNTGAGHRQCRCYHQRMSRTDAQHSLRRFWPPRRTFAIASSFCKSLAYYHKGMDSLH